MSRNYELATVLQRVLVLTVPQKLKPPFGGFDFWWRHRDWLGINACAAFVLCSLHFVCKHKLIVELATVLQRVLVLTVPQKLKPPFGGFDFWWRHRDSNSGPND